jgi:hypothetical protein
LAHTALVVIRRGRVAGVVPSSSPRVLSDYLSWPYEFCEVDTRERALALDLRLESCDAGMEFLATLRLAYQVERPEQVAIAIDDPLAELERAVAQGARQASRGYGVEQVKALEEHLADLFLYGDAIRQRAQSLGLAIRRAEVAIALDERARAVAEDLRHHTRERPIRFQHSVDSLDPERSFDVQVGGFYRLTDRMVSGAAVVDTAAAIEQAIGRTLKRIGITFDPSDYVSAAKAMLDALRTDGLLRTELSLAHAELLRPTVHIQPDRSMVHVLRSALPAEVIEPAPEPRRPRRRLIISEPQDSDDAPPWAGLAAATGRSLPLLDGPAPTPAAALSWESRPALPPPEPQPSIGTDLPPHADAVPTEPAMELDAPDGPVETSSTSPGTEDDGWRALMARHLGGFDQTDPADTTEQIGDTAVDLAEPAADTPPLPAPAGDAVGEAGHADAMETALPVAPPDADDEAADLPAWTGLSKRTDAAESEAPEGAPASTEPALDEPLASFVALLHLHGPAWFKMWTIELRDQPERLPEILSELTIDGWILNQAAEPRLQEALVRALQDSPDKVAVAATRPATARAPVVADVPDDQDLPDWMRLRRKWGEGGEE